MDSWINSLDCGPSTVPCGTSSRPAGLQAPAARSLFQSHAPPDMEMPEFTMPFLNEKSFANTFDKEYLQV